jgi:3-oxoadipate enol-lactonase
VQVQTDAGPLTVRFFGAARPAGSSSPPAMLALHPLAFSGELWRPAGEALGERGRTVLAPDLPANGALHGLSVADMARQVAAALDELHRGPVAVLGMSMGGCVALQLALDRPELVESLVLADTTSDYGPDRVEAWEKRAVSAETSSREALLDFQLDRWFTPDFPTTEPAETARITDIFTATPPAVHAACCRALGAFDVTARLGEITAPTLVLVGESDYATPLAMAQVLASGIPGAQLSVLPGVRHFSLIQSKQAWDLIEEHLRSTGS